MMNACPPGAWICWVSNWIPCALTRTVVSPVVPPLVAPEPAGFGEVPADADTTGAFEAPGPPDGLDPPDAGAPDAPAEAPPDAAPPDAAPPEPDAPAPALPLAGAGTVTDGSGANVQPEPAELAHAP